MPQRNNPSNPVIIFYPTIYAEDNSNNPDSSLKIRLDLHHMKPRNEFSSMSHYSTRLLTIAGILMLLILPWLSWHRYDYYILDKEIIQSNQYLW